MSDLKQAEASLEKKADSIISKFKTRRSWQVLGAVIFGIIAAALIFNAQASQDSNILGLVSFAGDNDVCVKGGGQIVDKANESWKKNFVSCELGLGDSYLPDNYKIISNNQNNEIYDGAEVGYTFLVRKLSSIETCFYMKASNEGVIANLKSFGNKLQAEHSGVKVATNDFNKYCYKNSIGIGDQNSNAEISSVVGGDVQLTSITVIANKEPISEPYSIEPQKCLDNSNNNLDINSLYVCGSVQQVYIINAEPQAKIKIGDPLNQIYTADEYGGLVIDGLEANREYLIWIGDKDSIDLQKSAYRVFVNSENDSFARDDLDNLNNITDKDGYIQTRDGTLLSYHLEFPEGGCSEQSPCDTLLTYSGYSPGLPPESFETLPFETFKAEGYAVIGVNMRGTACSGGRFKLMENTVLTDGYDIIETLAAQSWTRKIGMVGNSWPGISQLFVASTKPPSLSAIAAGATVTDFYNDIMYPGGIRNDGFGGIWLKAQDDNNKYPDSIRGTTFKNRLSGDTICQFNQKLRKQNVSLVDNFKNRPSYDSFWQDLNVDLSKITAPTIMTIAWQDLKTGSNAADQFDKLSGPKKLIGVNGGHDSYFEGDILAKVIEFMNIYMRGTDEDIATYSSNNDAVEILLERNDQAIARTSFSMGSINEAGDGVRYEFGNELFSSKGTQSPSTFTYESTKNALNWNHNEDKITFTSNELDRDIVMAGSGSVDLWISANNQDVDLQVSISEVRPDGSDMFIQKGFLRASKRALNNSSTARVPEYLATNNSINPLTPNEPTLMNVKLIPFAHAFRAGSKIRITVDSPPGPGPSLFWMFDTVPGKFDVSLFHDSQYRSSVVLPVISSINATELLKDLPIRQCGEITFQPCRN